MLLQADEVVYDSEAKTVSAVGHVEIADDGRTLLAERVDYDQAKRQGDGQRPCQHHRRHRAMSPSPIMWC